MKLVALIISSLAGCAIASAQIPTPQITLTNCLSGGTPGLLSVANPVPSTSTTPGSFTIKSSSATDTSTVCYSVEQQ